jgi:hypothetical protein
MKYKIGDKFKSLKNYATIKYEDIIYIRKINDCNNEIYYYFKNISGKEHGYLSEKEISYHLKRIFLLSDKIKVLKELMK